MHVDGEFYCTVWTVPELLILKQTEARQDNFIGITEMLGVILTLYTFRDLARNSLRTAYIGASTTAAIGSLSRQMLAPS